MSGGRHLACGAGEHVWFMGNLMTIKAGAGEGDTTSLIEGTLAAGHAPPLHVHRDEDESFYVLEGRVRFRIGDEVLVAAPGDYVAVPRGVAHAFRVEDGGARMLMMATSPCLAGFMRAVGDPAAEPVLPPPGEHDMRRAVEASARFDMTVVGGPLDR